MKLHLLIGLGLVTGLEVYGQNVQKIDVADTLTTHEKKIDEVLSHYPKHLVIFLTVRR
ncbi:hypothetical protein [Chryseobacterium sp. 52]|uniref:hypothetical protein n=1 Tax=Chryseobacterium sp. 52 TaxID=2035213 RepID=UPI0015D5029B|nr:hypothetical protein [Chryseobacterium sp. 52]